MEDDKIEEVKNLDVTGGWEFSRVTSSGYVMFDKETEEEYKEVGIGKNNDKYRVVIIFDGEEDNIITSNSNFKIALKSLESIVC